jgi:hypothetical protein
VTALRRSSGGLRSLHRFHGVDLVVFCEGGLSLSPSEVASGQGVGGTLDALYWSKVIFLLGVPGKCHCKSIGSKATLIEIAKTIEDNSIETITVCVDADYDRYDNEAVALRRLARSLGYSWENDICSKPVIEASLDT